MVALAHPMAGEASAATAPPGAAADPPAVGAGLDWAACTDLEAPKGIELECATLPVPLDHHAGGRSAVVEIALSRVPARAEATDALLVNPGGPGSGGRFLAARTAGSLPGDLRDSYDVIGFDPRGTGASTPAVGCDPDYFTAPRPDSVPATADDERLMVKRSRTYAEACERTGGALLNHMRTTDSAHDLDAIRAALGRERIDYLGYSYGTYLGGVYATLYPERVRRLVLDSVVHPDRSWYQGNLAQSRSLEAAAGRFFDWVARHDSAYGLGDTAEEVAGRYYATREALRARPVDDRIGPTELESTFLVAAYAAQAWPFLASALADLSNDNRPARLVSAFDRMGESPDHDPSFAAYLATECTDAPWPRSWQRWRTDARGVHADAPFLGWYNIWYNAPCAFWPAEPGEWFQVDGERVENALLVHATGDGPTPVGGAYAMHRRFPEARLVIEDGGLSHGVALRGNTCVDDAVIDYLREGRLPDAGGTPDGGDLVCGARPEPEPRKPSPAPQRQAAPDPGVSLGSAPPSTSGASAGFPVIPAIGALARINR
ncbi:alpha/beta hydrolase [Nocardiopsis mwathae]|nr:alpha/beta hydrolase [Nocardiopsis mwathae]